MSKPNKAPVRPVERRSINLNIRVRPSEKEAWAAAAKRDGTTLSKWVSRVCSKAAK